MCVGMHVHGYTCEWVCMCVGMHGHVWLWIYVGLDTHVHACVWACVGMDTHVHACVWACILQYINRKGSKRNLLEGDKCYGGKLSREGAQRTG